MLQIGQQLGSYEITKMLGKSGVGEVYRALTLHSNAKSPSDGTWKSLPKGSASRRSRLENKGEQRISE